MFQNRIIVGNKKPEHPILNERLFSSIVLLRDCAAELQQSGRYCQECRVQFSSCSALAEHICEVHFNVLIGENFTKIITVNNKIILGSNKENLQLCGKKSITKSKEFVQEKVETPFKNNDTNEKNKNYLDCYTKGCSCTKAELLERHFTVLYQRNKIYKCNLCDRELTFIGSLRHHIQAHSNRKNHCDYCDKICKPTELARHVRLHDLARRFQCDICEYRFDKKEALKKHIVKVHSNNVYQCEICERKCTRKESFRRHMRTHNAVKIKRYFECDECKSKFTQKGNLRRHMIRHIMHSTYSCEVCSKEFALPSQLDYHAKTHSDIKYECNICDNYTTVHFQSYKSHLRNHLRLKPFKCDTCEFKFSSRAGLKRHMITHNLGEKAYSCDLCESKFARSDGLKKHKLLHSGIKNLKCDHCEYRCHRKEHLKNHVRVHRPRQLPKDWESRPYKCNVCEYRFSGQWCLNRHKLLHLNARDYKCDLCEYSSTRSDALFKHMKAHSK